MGNMSVAGMIVKGISDHATGYLYTKEGRDKKRIALRNRDFAMQAAADARLRGDLTASRYKSQIGELTSAQRVAVAGSGVDVGKGTPVNIFEDTAMMGELDVLTILNNASREAWGHEVMGYNYLWAGEQAEFMGYAKKSLHMLGAASEGMSMGSFLGQSGGFSGG